MTLGELRNKYTSFIYERYEIKYEGGNLKIVFVFKMDPGIEFKPEITLTGISHEHLKKINPLVLENLTFNLGMVELLSYWKAVCPQKIIIKAGYLNDEQKIFWKNLYIKGMGEFYYKNQIDFTDPDFFDISVESEILSISCFKTELKDRDLVLVGGGKDSALTLDILGKSGREFEAFSLNPSDNTKQMIRIGGSLNPIYATRIIDPKLLQLNNEGYLNGHTPFSAYLAFLSVLASVVYDYKNIIVSNESSSNEGNVVFKNMEINHQYSKTFEFEELFRDYCKNFLSINSNYFSFLRPLCELQIASIFAKRGVFLQEFRSCNVGSLKGMWCGRCPKCLSTYICLYPFLGDILTEIFGKNILRDESNLTLASGLIRLNNSLKPFECVATVEETRVAIKMGIDRAKKDNSNLPFILEKLSQYGLDEGGILSRWNNKNNLPPVHKLLLQSNI